jgi:Fe-S oxidoreductase
MPPARAAFEPAQPLRLARDCERRPASRPALAAALSSRLVRGDARARPPDADVVLLVDTFTPLFRAGERDAALAVLRAPGYRVAIATAATERRGRCAAAARSSHGLVDEARARPANASSVCARTCARRDDRRLEPSCLLTLRDEFLALRLGDARASARRTRDADRGISYAREELAGRLDARVRAAARAACARARTLSPEGVRRLPATSVTALRWIPGLDVKMIESSCCGMARAFGYGTDHYDRIACGWPSCRLLPAVRNAPTTR